MRVLSAVANKSSTLQIALFATLALAGGIGVAYALLPTFGVIAGIVGLGLWLYTKGSSQPYLRSKRDMHPEKTEPEARGALTSRLVTTFLLVWWLTGVLALGRVWTGSELDYGVLLQSSLEDRGEEVLLNQLLVISYGAVGIIFLVSAMKRSSTALRWVLVLWMLYLCWGCLTLFWSVDAFASIRRLTGFTLISLGSIGFGAGFYGSHPNGRSLFLRHVIVGGVLSALALLIPLTFRWSEVNLLNPAYKLQLSTNTWTYVAYPALFALLVLFASPMLGLRRWRSYDWLLVLILILPVFLLKTRGPFLFSALALSAGYVLYRARVHDRVLQIGLLITLSLGACILYLQRTFDLLAPYLTREAGSEETYSLTGRIPLWEHLLADVGQNPLIGVGFGAYWTPENLMRVNQPLSSIVQAHYVVAHNGYIEELLATGAVGLTLLLIFWAYVMYTAVRRARQGDNLGWLVFLFVLLYLLLNLTQSVMQWYHELFPWIVPLALVALMESKRSNKHRRRVKEHGPQAQHKQRGSSGLTPTR